MPTVQGAEEDAQVLRVLCGTVELEDDGAVIALGDRLRRPASRRRPGWLPELAGIEWVLDGEAGAGGEAPPLVTGTVVGIEAVFTRLSARPGGGWAPAPGSVHLEPVASTASTRRIDREVAWGPMTEPDARGRAYRSGFPVLREGDEHCAGWLLALDDGSVGAPDAPQGR